MTTLLQQISLASGAEAVVFRDAWLRAAGEELEDGWDDCGVGCCSGLFVFSFPTQVSITLLTYKSSLVFPPLTRTPIFESTHPPLSTPRLSLCQRMSFYTCHTHHQIGNDIITRIYKAIAFYAFAFRRTIPRTACCSRLQGDCDNLMSLLRPLIMDLMHKESFSGIGRTIRRQHELSSSRSSNQADDPESPDIAD